jgi:inward rectifier potassium channel
MRQQSFDPGITQSYDGSLDRIVLRDGTFNVQRRGSRFRDFHFYQFLIGLSWPAFFGIVLAAFLAVNTAFTALYLATGIAGLQGVDSVIPPFLQVFFFSIQTLTTVGYGLTAPRGIAADVLSSIEAMLGVLGFAFSAGLLYGRFSRPVARLRFSTAAIIAPYQGGTSLQLRVANLRRSAIVDLEATLVWMSVEGAGAAARRTYARLELERPTIFFLPLTWTIVHPIDAASPLWGQSAADLAAHAAEVLVLVRGFDDTFNQVVNARTSYRFDEITWGRRFRPAFRSDHKGTMVLDLEKIDESEPASLADQAAVPAAAPRA